MSWEKVKLEDVCLSISDGDHQAPPKVDNGIPFVTISNINSTNKFDLSEVMYVPQEYYDHLDSKRKPQKEDILYSVVGSFGIPVYIDCDEKFVFQRHIAILRPDSKKIVSKFLYYVMLGREFYLQADAVAVGAAQRTVSLTALRDMTVNVPSMETQKKIADILSAYDKLIENNQKQIKLLEEAAQRLYKEWFVDLRFPGHEDVKIVDGVPEGWRYGELQDIVIDAGKREKKSNRDKYLYYLPIECLPKKSLTYKITNDITFAESSLVGFEANDIIFGAMRPYFHKVVFARDNGLTRTTCFVINAKKSSFWAYLLLLLFSTDTIQYANQISVGTTMPYVRWQDFIHMPIIIPELDVCRKFQGIIMNITKEISYLSDGYMKLKQARDRLLPKLISGEIQV